MKVTHEFVVARPIGTVWAFFQDWDAVAQCLPGAELLEVCDGGVCVGRMTARIGPYSASFEGEARISVDPEAHSGHVEGKGVDRRGGSRTRMTMDYKLTEIPEGTSVAVYADVGLSGTIAQFGRTGLISEASKIIIQEFVGVLEQRLAADSAEEAKKIQAAEIRGFRLVFSGLIAWIKSLFRNK